MAVFKCKMCNGNLDVSFGTPIIKCSYCDTMQTVPEISDEKKANLYNRANVLRFESEFDKASGIYEAIAAEFPLEAEAYWGLCLCKYGIEYVDDPLTHRKVPTCHRTSSGSIFNDTIFRQALEYADPASAELYRREAAEIDRLQSSILGIAGAEKPYDIFICYKESDENGQRTKDSIFAEDIYEALTREGYRVFFARVSLEDKLGQQYEPFIFAALNTARVMLSLGTRPEYFNAVWVKNEWSRFLHLMREDSSKLLVPCYCDMDPYDMPPEFRNLQGQDMGKLGFIQDLVRGIKKILPKNAQPAYGGPAGGYYSPDEAEIFGDSSYGSASGYTGFTGSPSYSAPKQTGVFGVDLPGQNASYIPSGIPPVDTSKSRYSKVAAAVLAFFLGFFGAHDFYCGNKTRGILKVILCFFTFTLVPRIWGFIDFILILAGKYKDGDGKPLT